MKTFRLISSLNYNVNKRIVKTEFKQDYINLWNTTEKKPECINCKYSLIIPKHEKYPEYMVCKLFKYMKP